MNLTAKQIARAVTSKTNSPFCLKKNDVVVENVSYGMFGWGEADLIALSRAGYLTEGEIKISRADFLNDKKKAKWKDNEAGKEWKKDIKQFYYIVPEELKDFALENTEHGIIGVSVTKTSDWSVLLHRPGCFNHSRKLFIEERMKLMRLGCFRAWRLYESHLPENIEVENGS